MKNSRLSKYLHELARVERYRVLRPLRHRFRHQSLWALNRHTVSRGVAVGFFFAILTPVAQFVFALIAALVVRAHPIVALASTLITNPFTLPFIYYYAYRVGSTITGRDDSDADVRVSEEAATHAFEVTGWIPTLMNWFQSVGWPLLVGALTLALTLALAGYLLVQALWIFIRTRLDARE